MKKQFSLPFVVMAMMFAVFLILAKASYDIREMGFAELWNSGKLSMLALVALILCIVQFTVGWFSDKKHPIESSQSMGQKNTTLVIWISSLYAGPVAAIAPTCYVIWQNLVLSWMCGRKKKK